MVFKKSFFFNSRIFSCIINLYINAKVEYVVVISPIVVKVDVLLQFVLIEDISILIDCHFNRLELQKLKSFMLLTETEINNSIVFFNLWNVYELCSLRERSVLQWSGVLCHFYHDLFLFFRRLNYFLRPDDSQLLNESVNTSMNAFTEWEFKFLLFPLINMNSNMILA